MEVVEEKDLFKYLVTREEHLDAEGREELIRNISVFASKFPQNIFRNQYFVLHEAILKARKYNTVLTRDQLYQIIINNIDKLVRDERVDREEFSETPDDLNVVREEFADLCMVTYDELQGIDIEDSGNLTLNCDLYIESWGKEELQRIISTQYEIITSGKKIGSKFLQGMEEGDSYYKVESMKILQMVRNELEDMTQSVIRTDTMSFDEIKERFTNEGVSRNVSRTGIDGVDGVIGPLRKGDLMSILGQPGAGKSRMNANIIYQGIISGNNVLWYPLEGSATQAFSLIVARHIIQTQEERLDLDDKNIYDVSYPEHLAEMVDVAIHDLLTNPEYGKFQIRNVDLYDDELIPEMEKEWDEGFHFDILSVDYVSLIMNKKNEAPNQYLSRLIKELKKKALNFRGEGYLLLLPHQLTKDVIQKLVSGDDLTITGSADTSEVIKSSDISISLYSDDEQRMREALTIYFTKARFSAGREPLEVGTKMGKCFFHDMME